MTRVDLIRSQLARYEGHVLHELGQARREARAAARRVEEWEVELAHVREALRERQNEQLALRAEA